MQSQEIVLFDVWNSSSSIENTFYTEPFRNVLLKNNYTGVETITPKNTTHIFKVKAPLLSKGQVLCIIGSVPELGEWNTETPLLLSRMQNEDWLNIQLDLSKASFPLEYKYGVYEVNRKKFLQYEGGKNRFLYDKPSETKLTVISDGFAVLPNNSFKGAGVAIPVFSLKSENGLGVGEFNDLKLMVDWAKEVGLKVVQILPG
jgi:4-alpha-glucanotransferase